MTYQVTAIILISLSLSFIGVPEAPAQYFGGVTVLGVNKAYNSGLVERVQILWDGKSDRKRFMSYGVLQGSGRLGYSEE